jgi:hypothetical protein
MLKPRRADVVALLRLAIPVVVVQVGIMFMGTVDTLMVGRLSPTALAAVGRLFGLRGGDQYFMKAQNVVNNAPETNALNGWKPFDGLRNRYWLVENLTNPKYNPIHDAIYNYYRLGLDQMFDHQDDARKSILNALIAFNSINIEFPNIMFMQFFFQGKGSEIGNVFKHGMPEEKSRALDILTRIDVSNLNQYKQDLQ